MHDDMLAKSRAFRDENTKAISSVADIEAHFAADGLGFVKVPVELLKDDALDAVMKKHSLSTRNMPFEDEGRTVLIAKAY